ncbi:MAG: Ig-like domain-containing protein [Cyclobacteriaceae bacterium]|nr:Ig-like domain-containing protein [Cyclobacteriaceae bacterium]
MNLKYLAPAILTLALLAGCDPEDEPVIIGWDNERAVSLTIKRVHAEAVDLSAMEVRLIRDGERAPILGTFTLDDDGDVIFTPVVPLTRGMRYEILEEGVTIGEVSIPESDEQPPVVLQVYPTADTVPENLLKVYLHFSQSMEEGRSAKYVHLLKDGKDTMNGTFLDLQPELWNEDGTVLTMWLDPGRIKLDLIPNKTLGNPLQQGVAYTLHVASGWRSKEGIALAKPWSKPIVVGGRDDKSPDVQSWSVKLPEPGSKEGLTIGFGEPLDWMLVSETIHITDDRKSIVPGTIQVNEEERTMTLAPEKPWTTGTYTLSVDARLEDLSGNNLNRLFEVDLTKSDSQREPLAVHTRSFMIR